MPLFTLKNIGERKAVDLITRQLDKTPATPVPFGDDVAAWSISKNRLAVLKTDMLVGKTDVPPSMNLWQAARKAVVMNVSDFAAKGVKPLAILASLGLPKELTKKDVEEIGRGLNSGAREYGAYVIGGDTGEAPDLVISVSVFGMAKENRLTLRSSARPGDLLATTGLFGKTSAGLKILVEGIQTTPKLRRILVESVLMPRARLREGLALWSSRATTAAIDSSDGLAWSLHEIARASNVGFSLDRLPIAKEAGEFAKLDRLNPLDLTLYGGEEYELIITIKPQLLEKARRAAQRAGGSLEVIGTATSNRQVILKTEDRRVTIKPQGYEHFKDIKI